MLRLQRTGNIYLMGLFYNKASDKLFAEGIRLLYSQAINVSSIQVMLALAIYIYFFNETSGLASALWLIAITGVYLIRRSMIKNFNRDKKDDADVLKWGRYFSYTALITGLAWGSSVFIFIDGYDQRLIGLYCVVTLITVGAIIATSYWLEGLYAFSVPAIGLLALKLFISNDSILMALGIALLLLLLAIIFFGKLNNKITLGTINYKFMNLENIRQLEQANNSKSRFFASANHDLRQPINSLNLITNSLQTETHTERSKELLTSLDKTMSRLTHLLDSLLDISSIESGSLSYQNAPCSLDNIFKTLLVEHLEHCSEKDIELRVRPSRHWARSDERALDRILGNLLNNAIKYTKQGGILVACRAKGVDRLSIEIWDTGIGISEDDIRHVHEEFYQADNDQRDNSKGLGLGLSISHKLAEQMNHELTLSSRLGRGTVVKLEVDVTIRPQKTPEYDTSFVALNTQNYSRVLIIEDDEMSKESLAALFQARKCSVLTAGSYAEVLKLAKEASFSPELIISDYRLPNNRNGVEVIDKIRELASAQHLPSILVSGDIKPDLSQKNSAGEILFLSKPINIGELNQTIHRLESKSAINLS